MLGRTLGSYRIDKSLGSGGMGWVYQAETTRNCLGLPAGTRVALKVIHPHLLETEGFFKRFLREAEIGKAVHHLNVVHCHDADALRIDGEQVHFLVMEYVEGQTLRELLNEMQTVPEELCRHIGRAAAAGLAAIHQARVIHRDLKPENILITPEHEVKIMDLGVALLADELIRLSRTGAFVGTVLYAAPEQFKAQGRDLDGRADLFSLGAILYELATGALPHPGDAFPGVMKSVLETEPRPLADRNPQLSLFFEEVVHSLLAKDPADRIESAACLHAILEAGEQSDWWTQRAREIRARTKEPLRRIRIPRETSVYGREDELATLRTLFEKARSGEGQVVLVEGEAGIGKSRLLDEMVERLRQDGVEMNFLFGTNPPGGAATAAGAWSTAYRERLGAEGLEDTLRGHLPTTPSLVPAFAALLRGEPPPEGQPALTKDSIHTVFVQVTRSLATERPTVVLIEDLHFAPEEGLALFAALALAIPEHPILLVGTSRPGLPEDWRAGLERLMHTQRLGLRRLGPKDLVDLLVDAFQSERLSEKLGTRIAARSDGNPFFVFEILRGLREEGLISRGPDGSWISTQAFMEIQIPDSVRELVNARISGLDEEDQELLDLAACCGFEFDPILLAEVLGMKAVPVLRRLARLEHAHQLICSAGKIYFFDHHQMQETLYDRLSEPLREQYHAAIADVLERRHPDPQGAHAVQVCEQQLRGGLYDRARATLKTALGHLEQRYENDRAIALADRALLAPGMLVGEERVEIILLRDRRLDLLGRREQQHLGLEQALEIVETTGSLALRARVRKAVGDHRIRTSDLGEAKRHMEEARKLAQEAGDRQLEGQVTGSLASIARMLGRMEEARHLGEEALALARAADDLQGGASALGNLGLLYWKLGRHAQARANLEGARAAYEQIGNRHGVSSATGNMGLILKSQGSYEEARVQFERDLTISREIGHRFGEATATGNLGNVMESLGRYEDAHRHLERALDLSREIGDRQGEARHIGNLAAACWGQGLLAECRDRLEHSLALSKEMGDRHGEAFTLGEFGLVLETLGWPEQAKNDYERSRDLAKELGDRHQEGYALGLLAVLAERQGEAERAMALNHECLMLRLELGERDGVGLAQIALARLEAAQGKEEEASERLSTAMALGMETRTPGTLLSATIELARLPGGDVTVAQAALAEHEARIPCTERMAARYRMYELTRDFPHLEEAHRLLRELQARAPEEFRDKMLTNVPLHQDILEAWRRRE